MASLSGQNPSATFPSLIKTIDNNPVSASLVQLSDGNGNALPISISTVNVSISSALTASIVAATNNGNGTNFKVGDDVFIGDVNLANTMQVKGQQSGSQGYIKYSNFVNGPILGANSSSILELTGSLNVKNGIVGYTPTAYLSAYHTASLFGNVENTPLTMSYSTTDYSYGGVTISGSYSDKIKIDASGIYNIQFSAQINKTTNAFTKFYIWLVKNGVEVPFSNTGIALAGNANDEAIPAWNFYTSASAGDSYQINFAVTHNNGIIEYKPSGSAGLTGPAVPSVILTVNRVG